LNKPQPASELVVALTGSKGSSTKKPVTSVKSGKLISHKVSPKKISANQEKWAKILRPEDSEG
jgi:hypothetical protein